MDIEKKPFPPIAYVLIAVLLWSTGGLFIKLTTLDAYQVTFFRSLLAAITVLLVTRKHGLRINGFGILATLIYSTLLFLFVWATKHTTAANAILKAEIEKSHRNLRSAAMPTCAELDKADWLFTVVIRGSDVYEVNGNKYSISMLLQTYTRELSEANKDGCRHRVKVYYGKDVSLPEYDYALRRIEQYFYDLKLGSET